MMLPGELQPEQWFSLVGKENLCPSTNIFAKSVRKNLRPCCKARKSPLARRARAPGSNSSFRSSAWLDRDRNQAHRPRAHAAPAATRADQARARWISRKHRV